VFEQPRLQFAPLEQSGRMRFVNPDSLHAANLRWNLAKGLGHHGGMDGAHLAIALALALERGAAVGDQRHQCPHAVGMQRIGVGERTHGQVGIAGDRHAGEDRMRIAVGNLDMGQARQQCAGAAADHAAGLAEGSQVGQGQPGRPVARQ